MSMIRLELLFIKLSHREVKWLASSHTAIEHWGNGWGTKSFHSQFRALCAISSLYENQHFSASPISSLSSLVLVFLSISYSRWNQYLLMKCPLCVRYWSLDHEYKTLSIIIANADGYCSQVSLLTDFLQTTIVLSHTAGRITLSDSRNQSSIPRVCIALPEMRPVRLLCHAVDNKGVLLRPSGKGFLAKMFTVFYWMLWYLDEKVNVALFLQERVSGIPGLEPLGFPVGEAISHLS